MTAIPKLNLINFIALVAASAVLYADQDNVSTSEESLDSIQKTVQLEKMVVTATRSETSIREIANSISVVDRYDIDRKNEAMAIDYLRELPGLDVVQSGGLGKNSGIFMRGANSEHTLFLIDGIEMNDPISPGRSADFGGLTVNNIERIEVLRGPQSTLYGSDGIGGVINIITKAGGERPSFFFTGEGGSFLTFNEMAGVNGSYNFVNYSVGLSRVDSRGFSAASEHDGNAEPDGYHNTSVSARIGVSPLQNLSFDVVSRFGGSTTDIDNFGGAGGDDPNSLSQQKQFSLKASGKIDLLEGNWTQNAAFSLSDHDRNDRNDRDADHPDDYVRSSYDSRIYKLEWQNTFDIRSINTLTAGVEGEEESGKSDYYSESMWGVYESSFKKEVSRTAGFFIQDQLKLFNCIYPTIGGRIDYHTRFGVVPTFRIGSAFLVDKIGMKIRGTIGTGFKTPSLYQLFSEYGDKDLRPERSIGFDFGIEENLLNDRLFFGVTIFSNKYDSLIEFDNTAFKYKNISKARSKGFELSPRLRPIPELNVGANYTYTVALNSETGDTLLRRPKHKLSGEISYRFFKRVDVGLNGVYVGKRYDYPHVKLNSYSLINLFLAIDITSNIKIFGRLNNLLNEEYEEIDGYGTAGISGSGGIKLSF